jgi:hypothetical protein
MNQRVRGRQLENKGPHLLKAEARIEEFQRYAKWQGLTTT